MEALFIYVLTGWFGFFLLNYAEITKPYAYFAKEALGPKLGYPLSCALCFMFWITLGNVALGLVPVYYLFVAPVLHLFVDCIYSKLGCGEPPVAKLDLEAINERIAND